MSDTKGVGTAHPARPDCTGPSGCHHIAGGSGADFSSVFARSHTGLGPELAVEVRQVLVAGVEADLGDGAVGLEQQRALPDHAQSADGVGEATTCGAEEESGK